MDELSGAYNLTKDGVKSLESEISRSSIGLVRNTSEAIDKIAAWDSAIRSHSENLSQAAGEAFQKSNSITKVFDSRTRELFLASQKADKLHQNLLEHTRVISKKNFAQHQTLLT